LRAQRAVEATSDRRHKGHPRSVATRIQATDVGSEFDIVLGLRNLFGVKRLGLDARLGWFFPGNAFVTNAGTEENPGLRPADRSTVPVAKLWW